MLTFGLFLSIGFTKKWKQKGKPLYNKLLVYSLMREVLICRRFLAYVKNSKPTYELIATAPAEGTGDGRFVLAEDIEVRALTNKQFLVEAYLPDGRRTEMTRLEPAPEQLLKAIIDDYGKTLNVELVGEEGVMEIILLERYHKCTL